MISETVRMRGTPTPPSRHPTLVLQLAGWGSSGQGQAATLSPSLTDLSYTFCCQRESSRIGSPSKDLLSVCVRSTLFHPMRGRHRENSSEDRVLAAGIVTTVLSSAT